MKAAYLFRGSLAAAFFLFFALFQPFFAQKTPVSPTAPPVVAPLPESAEFVRSASIGLNFGTKALVGLDYGMRFTEKIGARLGFNYARFDLDRSNVEIVGTNRYDVSLFQRMSNIEALGEWSPTKKGGFRAVVGFGVFFKNEVGGSGGISNNTQLNDVEVEPEDIGTGKLTVGWRSPVSGYAGLAFGRLVPKKRMNLSFEMGGWLKGSPRFDVEATQLLSDNERNEPILNENFRNQKFFPNLSFRLAYKL